MPEFIMSIARVSFRLLVACRLTDFAAARPSTTADATAASATTQPIDLILSHMLFAEHRFLFEITGDGADADYQMPFETGGNARVIFRPNDRANCQQTCRDETVNRSGGDGA